MKPQIVPHNPNLCLWYSTLTTFLSSSFCSQLQLSVATALRSSYCHNSWVSKVCSSARHMMHPCRCSDENTRCVPKCPRHPLLHQLNMIIQQATSYQSIFFFLPWWIWQLFSRSPIQTGVADEVVAHRHPATSDGSFTAVLSICYGGVARHTKIPTMPRVRAVIGQPH